MTLHVFGHVEAHQLDAQGVGQLARDFRLPHPGGTGEQERTDGLALVPQAGAGHLDGAGQGLDGLVLPEHDHFQVALQVAQGLHVVAADLLRRDAGDLGDDVFDLADTDHLLALAGG